MSIGKEALDTHLSSGIVLSGVLRGRWRIVEHTWPLVFIDVIARDGRAVPLRFDCAGYPDQPPTAMPWDAKAQCQLAAARWPCGGRVSQVFNPGWKGGSALYIPCDRQAIEGHSGWLSQYPWMIWQPDRGLVHYLQLVWEILQSNELQPAA